MSKINNKREVSEITKAHSVKNQKKVCDQMLQQRILIQTPMTKVAKLPNYQFYAGGFVSSSILEKMSKSKRHIK